MRWERECEGEEGRVMLIRNHKGHVPVDGLDSMETRMCLVSGTLSVDEQNRTRGLVESTVDSRQG